LKEIKDEHTAMADKLIAEQKEEAERERARQEADAKTAAKLVARQEAERKRIQQAEAQLAEEKRLATEEASRLMIVAQVAEQDRQEHESLEPCERLSMTTPCLIWKPVLIQTQLKPYQRPRRLQLSLKFSLRSLSTWKA